ncbi:5-histidylcysteine sulfoxide synthase [Thalassotalea euphylliae]|uniref:5-histidylcysteine sulfoxide synthase n=1 Tax=Thalassotalea euphylliae TaxID=1655234 RepID=A0A3E0TWL1_9GAMM|nr:5-histidylcysteine sulfoxide synthase [Thalassotalea euphylliae]REL28988.1 5-histidylcysteine sulfoxide synthase [Thalassotalea euphylliae]
MTKQQLKTPYLIANDVNLSDADAVAAKRAELKAYFVNSWQTYESLFALINNDNAFYARPEPLRHPLIFYYGHTATFYINKLMLGKFIHKRINEKLEAICAVGVDEMSWDDLNSEHYDWPKVDEVRTYRDQVFALVCDLIDNMALQLPITQDSLAWIILMGSEHERIHLETSSVIMRMLPLSDLTANAAWADCPYQGEAPLNELVPVAKQVIKLGKKTDDHTYGWDNEYGTATLDVPAFRTSKFLVSNQEFMQFVEAGGYQTPEYWTEEGQSWLRYKQATMPRFWLKKEGRYYQRNLLGEVPLPLNWPVEVNYLEAKAFCNWLVQTTGRDIRLPTEPEWYALREKVSGDLPSWQEAPGNTNLEYFASSCPVDKFDNQGIFDVVGNVWQWTESSIDAFEGFKVHPLYDDFSTPTFDGKHNLIKGGSWISTGNEAIASSRYAFRRHFFQHAGFRYVESESADMPLVPANHFEQNVDVCQQLQSHYQETGFTGGNYQQQLAQQVRQWLVEHNANTEKLLDLGCSVGRTSFELADVFEHVDGVDFSARYIQHGVQLQTGEPVRFETVQEGDIVDFHEVALADTGLSAASNILFSQGDATNLKAIFADYDVILAQQVLEQCYDPKQFLKQVANRLNQGALLIIASDYQFNSDVAAKEKWLGGIKVNGENLVGFEGVQQTLGERFELLDQTDLHQVIKIAQRISAVSQKHITLWRYNG